MIGVYISIIAMFTILYWVFIRASMGHILSVFSLFSFLFFIGFLVGAAEKEEKIKKEFAKTNNECPDEHSNVKKLMQNLNKLSEVNPDLLLLSMRMGSQLDLVDSLLSRFNDFAKMGRSIDLSIMHQSLENAKDEIIQNILDIIVYCKAAGSDSGGVAWEQVNQTAINEKIECNDEKLALVRELLDDVVEAITQKDNIFSNMELESWITAMRQANNHEETMSLGT